MEGMSKYIYLRAIVFPTFQFFYLVLEGMWSVSLSVESGGESVHSVS